MTHNTSTSSESSQRHLEQSQRAHGARQSRLDGHQTELDNTATANILEGPRSTEAPPSAAPPPDAPRQEAGK